MKKTIVVTGSSTGFGKLTVQTLAQDGHQVFATMRGVNGKNAEHAAALTDWAKEHDVDLTVVELDVTSDDSVKSAVQTILASAAGVDVVVNNAGIYGNGLQEAFTAEDYKNIYEVNVFGSVRVINEFLPLMRKQGSGLLIQVSSVVGRVVFPFQAAYVSSKFAVEAIAENLRYELAPLGIDSVIVQPGTFVTELFQKFYQPANTAVYADYDAPLANYQHFGNTFTQMVMAEDMPNQPQHVADAIKQVIDTPAGERPLRVVVDAMMPGTAQAINEVSAQVQEGIMGALGLGELLQTKKESELMLN
jgi:NAD(P)-dependent dehydrogenase (short-subunit alcohol dehydrogenase family)